MSNGISSYYPAGQRLLEKKGYDEYNYENFLKVYSKDIKDDDLKIIKSKNKSKINKKIRDNVRKIELFGMLLYLIIFLFGISVKNLLVAIKKGTRFMMETDYIDDLRRPGAVLGPKTVPKRTLELLKNNILTEKQIYEIHQKNPEKTYDISLEA